MNIKKAIMGFFSLEHDSQVAGMGGRTGSDTLHQMLWRHTLFTAENN